MIRIKEGFKGERLLSLPDEVLASYSKQQLIAPLFVRKIGYFSKVKYHYVQKSLGVNYYMLIYCVSGRGWYTINNTKRYIGANEFIILPKDTVYSFGADEANPWSIYWVHYEGILANQFLPSSIYSSFSLENSSRMQDRLDLFEELYASFSRAYIKEYMIQTSMVLYHYLASFLFVEQFDSYRLSYKCQPTFSMQVISYMQENIGKHISLDELASLFNYSSSHFSALFSKETGVSPIQYFIQLKIQYACQYIELTDLKLIDIAHKVGFNELAYFSRIFTKEMGMSPSKYRCEQRQRAYL